MGSTSVPLAEKADTKEVEKEKKKEQTGTKRKSEVDYLGSTEMTETRTKRKLLKEEPQPQVQAQTTPLPSIEKKKNEAPQSEAKLARKKQIARKSKAPLSVPIEYYPFSSNKSKTAYEETLRGKV